MKTQIILKRIEYKIIIYTRKVKEFIDYCTVAVPYFFIILFLNFRAKLKITEQK